MTDKNDRLEEFEKRLSEKRLEETVQQAEITGIDTELGHEALVVTYQTVSGFEKRDYLPMPDRYHPAYSDLACLIEFTDSEPADLDSLRGKRVPFQDGEPQYAAMRKVCEGMRHAANEWDMDKRLSKASEHLGGAW